MGELIDLNRRLVAVCECGCDEWLIGVDGLMEWENITYFECTQCGERIEIIIKKSVGSATVPT